MTEHQFSPPTSHEIVTEALLLSQRQNILTVNLCQQILKKANIKNMESKLEEYIAYLATYNNNDNNLNHTERMIIFVSPNPRLPEIWLNSVKNSDHTISYWVQVPLSEKYIRAAMVKGFHLPLTAINIANIHNEYPGLYKQSIKACEGKMVQSEQVDPLFFQIILKCLLQTGYQPQ